MCTPAQSPDDSVTAGRARVAAHGLPLQPADLPPADLPPADLEPAGPRQAERDRWLRRRGLQRRLHDGASLQISALVPQLGVVRNRLADDEDGVRRSIDDLQDQLHTVLQELREVSREIYPPLLDQAGLGPALSEFADRVAVPLYVRAPAERLCPDVEGAVYFAVTECLALLEVGGAPADVVLRRVGGELVVSLDGVPARHATLMLSHIRAIGGEVTVAAAPDPETITMRIPCE